MGRFVSPWSVSGSGRRIVFCWHAGLWKKFRLPWWDIFRFYVWSVVVSFLGVWLCWGRYFQSQTGRDGEVVAIFCEVYRNRVGFQTPSPKHTLTMTISGKLDPWLAMAESCLRCCCNKIVKYLIVDWDSTEKNEMMNLQELILGKIKSHLIQRCHHMTKSTSLQLRNMKHYAIKMPQQKPVKPCVFILCCFYL